MRTAIILGLMYVADSIGAYTGYDIETNGAEKMVWIVSILIFMDIIDFFRDKK